MGQAEVLQLLKEKNPEWMDAHSISKKLGIRIQSISKNLRRLRNCHLVDALLVKSPKHIPTLLYRHKHDD